VHIATVPSRLAPGAEPCDFSRFFRALVNANYTGRISIESKLNDVVTELPVALTVMRKLVADAIDNDGIVKLRKGE
jgi:hydroxypyruvate isomerase